MSSIFILSLYIFPVSIIVFGNNSISSIEIELREIFSLFNNERSILSVNSSSFIPSANLLFISSKWFFSSSNLKKFKNDFLLSRVEISNPLFCSFCK